MFDPIAMFDPNADPLADPALADLIADKLMRAADHPWEMEVPPAFDPLEAAGRFLELVRDVEAVVGQSCEVEVWPTVRSATFHGELVLPTTALAGDGFAVVRASNFGNLIAVLNDASAVRPEVRTALLARVARHGYRFLPSARLRRAYDGHHRATKRFAN